MEKKKKRKTSHCVLAFLAVAMYDRYGGPQDSCAHRNLALLDFLCDFVVLKLSVSSKSLSRVKLYTEKK